MIKRKNIEAGRCNTEDEQSTDPVEIYAVDDPNTVETDRQFCQFQCKEGYFDTVKGYDILFKCVPNSDKESPIGTKDPPPAQCEGACVIYVLAFSARVTFWGGGVVGWVGG